MQSNLKHRTTQRRLILVRHAKAMEEAAGGDHARILSERGRADAAALGTWLEEHALKPDLVLCSTAARTRETLALLVRTTPTILSDKLYLATAGEMLAQLQAVDDTVATVMMVGHNPGAHALLALLVDDYANEADADRMMLKFPTSACAVVSFEGAHWKDIAPETARLELLRY